MKLAGALSGTGVEGQYVCREIVCQGAVPFRTRLFGSHFSGWRASKGLSLDHYSIRAMGSPLP